MVTDYVDSVRELGPQGLRVGGGSRRRVPLLRLELPFRDATPQPQGEPSDVGAMNHVTSAPGLQSERETPVHAAIASRRSSNGSHPPRPSQVTAQV